LQADYAAIVDGMKKAGIGAEFFAWLKTESLLLSTEDRKPFESQRNQDRDCQQHDSHPIQETPKYQKKDVD
jgi:hypothetical protein